MLNSNKDTRHTEIFKTTLQENLQKLLRILKSWLQGFKRLWQLCMFRCHSKSVQCDDSAFHSVLTPVLQKLQNSSVTETKLLYEKDAWRGCLKCKQTCAKLPYVAPGPTIATERVPCYEKIKQYHLSWHTLIQKAQKT